MPDELVGQWEEAPAFFEAFGWPSLHAGDLEADDLLGTLAGLERAAGGRAVLFTGDRDMFQCVDEQVRVLFPAKGGPDVIDVAGVRERYGIEPAQVPDLIALRGDPSELKHVILLTDGGHFLRSVLGRLSLNFLQGPHWPNPRHHAGVPVRSLELFDGHRR